ncbi:hypothetical protein [Leifsonia aquatica]|uniref:hypothetical protein n=1 Tax=Leifsonia aquatica TaxID=144185 RepID=UPI0038180D50
MKPGLIVAGVFALVLAGLLGIVQLGIAHKNPCARYGPVPAEAFDRLNGGIVTETRTLWPIGSVCVWARADPDGAVRDATVRSHVGDYGTSLTTYGLAVGGAVSLIGGAIPSAVYARDRRSSHTK